MTAPKLHEHTSPARESSGPRIATPEKFPRRGVFCIVAGMLAIVTTIGRRSDTEIEQPNPKAADDNDEPKTRKVRVPVVDDAWPMAEVHLVETRDGHKNFGHFRRAPDDFELGEVQERGGEIFNVPFEAIERAPWAVLAPIIDARNGDAPRPSELWARRAGYVLDDTENAAADEQAKLEGEAQERAAYIASRPEAAALEADIDAELQAFVADVASRRQTLADKLLADRASAKTSDADER